MTFSAVKHKDVKVSNPSGEPFVCVDREQGAREEVNLGSVASLDPNGQRKTHMRAQCDAQNQ